MEAENIIIKFGGTKKVAELCKVSAGAVSQWKRTGIPEYRLQYLRLLRPDVFQQSTTPTQEAA